MKRKQTENENKSSVFDGNVSTISILYLTKNIFRIIKYFEKCRKKDLVGFEMNYF